MKSYWDIHFSHASFTASFMTMETGAEILEYFGTIKKASHQEV
jgi:hypothetical protein